MSSDDELGYDEPGYNAQVYELRAYIDICISQNDEISPHTLVTMVLAGAILTDEYDRVTNLPDNHSCKRPQYVDFLGLLLRLQESKNPEETRARELKIVCMGVGDNFMFPHSRIELLLGQGTTATLEDIRKVLEHPCYGATTLAYILLLNRALRETLPPMDAAAFAYTWIHTYGPTSELIALKLQSKGFFDPDKLNNACDCHKTRATMLEMARNCEAIYKSV